MSKPKEEPKNLLDMTTEEAADFLFPKKAVEKLKDVANPERHDVKANENGDSGCDDESYA